MSKLQSKNEEMLSRGPILKIMLTMGIPAFLAQLINLLYSIVDRIYIGHIKDVGSMALTGVGITFPVITLITAFAMLIGAGGAPLAGIAFGKGDKDKAEKILGNSVTMLVILSVILSVTFQIVKEPFLLMFGASEVTYPYAGEYLSVYLWGTIFVMITIGLNPYISTQGEPNKAMITVLIGAAINIILDPIFIFVFEMGVKGAAIATVLSQAVSSLWILKFLLSEKATLKIKQQNLTIEWPILGSILALGISPFIMSATESLITVVFNSGALKYGNDLYVGAVTIMESMIQIIFVPMNGFTNGCSPIISYNYGAGNYERVKKVSLTLLGITGVVCFVVSGLFILLPGVFSSFFTTDKDLIVICEKMIPIFFAGMLVFGLQSGSQVSFVALGKAKQALFFALLRKVILLTPLALILPKATGNIMGLFIAEPISDAISAITCVTVFFFTLRSVTSSNIETIST